MNKQSKYSIRGFTLIELLVTLILIGLVAQVSFPLTEVFVIRHKEAQLRDGLRAIRIAIDDYKAAADSGLIAKASGDSGYPPSLQALSDGVDAYSTPEAIGKKGRIRKIYFLRRIPRDPFCDDDHLSDAETWSLRSYLSPPDDPQPGSDVFDVASTSTKNALDGSKYNEW